MILDVNNFILDGFRVSSNMFQVIPALYQVIIVKYPVSFRSFQVFQCRFKHLFIDLKFVFPTDVFMSTRKTNGDGVINTANPDNHKKNRVYAYVGS